MALREATYIVDEHNRKGGGISAYSLPSDGLGAGARPVDALPRRCDGDCKGRGDKEEGGEQREAEHVDGWECEGAASGLRMGWGGKKRKTAQGGF